MTSKTHLDLRGKTYYARIVIPAHLRVQMRRTKFNESLKTGNLREAIVKSEGMIANWKGQIAVAEHAVKSGIDYADADTDASNLTESLIMRVDDEVIRLRNIIHVQAHQTHGTKGALLRELIDARHMIEYLESGQADFSANFKSYMAKGGIWITEASTLWQTRYPMSVDIFKRGIETYVKLHKTREAAKVAAMSDADYINHLTAPAPKPATVNRFFKPEDASDTITECFDRIVKARPRIRDNRKELGRWKNVVDGLIDHLGENKPANYIAYAEATDFLTSMENYPAVRSRRELVGKSFTQKIEWVKERKSKGFDEKCVSNRTIDDWCGKLAIICDLAIQDGKAFMNPFRNQNIQVGRESVEKVPFTQDELFKIFSNIKNEKNKDRFWISLFLLYHGCRLSEFANRTIDELARDDKSGIWYIDITKAKNPSSKRRLPIHEKILNLGFLEHVKNSNRNDSNYIFGSFNTKGRIINGSHRPSHPPSHQYTNWFNERFLRKGQGITDPAKTLHCFRHNWVSRASDIGIEKMLRVKLVGHTSGTKLDVHDDIYTHKELIKLKQALDLVRFEVLEPILK